MLNIPVPTEELIHEVPLAANPKAPLATTSWYNYWMETGAQVRKLVAGADVLNSLVAGAANANLIINGCHDISQELGNNGTAANNVYLTDQWMSGVIGTTAATVIVRKQDVVPVGFGNSVQLYATTADAAVAAGDLFCIQQTMEGTRWGVLGWGTANALPVAVGFWVYVSAGATEQYCLAVRNGATNRSYVHPFTITTGDAWQYVTFVIPGDTTGTWPKDNTLAAWVSLVVMGGTTYNTTADTWTAGSFLTVAGQANLFATINKSFLFTGVTILPLPLGTTVSPLSAALSPLLMRDPVQELALCQRYWWQPTPGNPNFFLLGYNAAGQGDGVAIAFPCKMRVPPTATVTGTWTATNCSQPNFYCTDDTFGFAVTVTALGPFRSQPTAGGKVIFSARM